MHLQRALACNSANFSQFVTKILIKRSPRSGNSRNLFLHIKVSVCEGVDYRKIGRDESYNILSLPGRTNVYHKLICVRIRQFEYIKQHTSQYKNSLSLFLFRFPFHIALHHRKLLRGKRYRKSPRNIDMNRLVTVQSARLMVSRGLKVREEKTHISRRSIVIANRYHTLGRGRKKSALAYAESCRRIKE